MQDRFAMNERQAQSGGRLGLYPEIAPYRTGRLKVSALHELYFEECGNPDGKPAVLLHGGPGGGSTAMMRRYHRSGALPHCALRSARLRPLDAACLARGKHHLASRRRHRAAARASQASSAGRCSAAPGAPRSRSPTPRRTPSGSTELVLRGIFTLRRAELEWFYQEGCSWIFPEAFEDYFGPFRRPSATI